ncbi:4-hydroxybenzoate octaprenyltransferase [Alteromonas oceanisediminis]|uniref:4-hydroxybenzoate octaprenyltransferase n=1 Tax=Alteromonas oceanisediminis TaxID=2836180 RepID=UPI001BDB0828|nr:4-hydroxybenzoate octaprenyltransferase [Alteromonas oceanisediminis]MBT0586766.1 4-hydroxybenzoate octaprenyltransferase [Alteromonas oceanisediminis]
MRADKPIGIYLLLWPTFWAILIAAQGEPSLHISIVFALGVVVMRSAGCVINDIADRRVDGQVKRTAQRPLVSGAVTLSQALWLFVGLVLAAFALVLTLNLNTILLSFVALLLAAVYPLMKRYTHLPQVVLGAAFSWSMPMAAMAILNEIPAWVWWLYSANLLWTVAYDTQYAMVDRDDDVRIGVKSTAILFGQYDWIIISLLQTAFIALLCYVGWILHFSLSFYLCVVFSAILLIRQQIRTRQREREACFNAFLNNHYVGLLITLGIGLHYWL